MRDVFGEYQPRGLTAPAPVGAGEGNSARAGEALLRWRPSDAREVPARAVGGAGRRPRSPATWASSARSASRAGARDGRRMGGRSRVRLRADGILRLGDQGDGHRAPVVARPAAARAGARARPGADRRRPAAASAARLFRRPRAAPPRSRPPPRAPRRPRPAARARAPRPARRSSATGSTRSAPRTTAPSRADAARIARAVPRAGARRRAGEAEEAAMSSSVTTLVTARDRRGRPGAAARRERGVRRHRVRGRRRPRRRAGAHADVTIATSFTPYDSAETAAAPAQRDVPPAARARRRPVRDAALQRGRLPRRRLPGGDADRHASGTSDRDRPACPDAEQDADGRPLQPRACRRASPRGSAPCIRADRRLLGKLFVPTTINARATDGGLDSVVTDLPRDLNGIKLYTGHRRRSTLHAPPRGRRTRSVHAQFDRRCEPATRAASRTRWRPATATTAASAGRLRQSPARVGSRSRSVRRTARTKSPRGRTTAAASTCSPPASNQSAVNVTPRPPASAAPPWRRRTPPARAMYLKPTGGAARPTHALYPRPSCRHESTPETNHLLLAARPQPRATAVPRRPETGLLSERDEPSSAPLTAAAPSRPRKLTAVGECGRRAGPTGSPEESSPPLRARPSRPRTTGTSARQGPEPPKASRRNSERRREYQRARRP